MVALLELVLEYTYNDEPCVNRWNYISSSTPAAVSLSFALVSAVGGITESPHTDFPTGSMMENIRVALGGGVLFNNIQARNIYSVTDFYDTPIPSTVTGAITSSTGMTGYEAYGFYSSQTRTDIRGGQKRFAGVVEGAVGAFGVIESAQMTLLNNIAAAMTAEVTYDDEGSPVTFNPVIVSKEKYVTPSGKDAYKYYATLAEQDDHWATGIIWRAYPNSTTQNTRKKRR